VHKDPLERIAVALEKLAARSEESPALLAPRLARQSPAALNGKPYSATDSHRLDSIEVSLGRIADALVPAPSDIVGTPYIAKRLGCTTAWVTDLIKKGEIPKACIVEGTGHGKVWKLHRRQIDEWIKGR
jgi:hypothetical protein